MLVVMAISQVLLPRGGGTILLVLIFVVGATDDQLAEQVGIRGPLHEWR